MRVLFDQGTPVPIRRFLTRHSVRTAAEQAWSKLENGQLLDAAEADGFDVLLTTDKKLKYQQNLSRRRIAIVVLGESSWPVLRNEVQRVVAAVDAATPGSYTEVEIPHEGGDRSG
jgi:glutamate racemase